MEEKILQELKEIKEMLRIVARNTEQKEIKIDANYLADMFSESIKRSSSLNIDSKEL